MKEHIDRELYRLRSGFNALNTEHKKGVLKTAKGLLGIQRAHKDMVADSAGNSVFSVHGEK